MYAHELFEQNKPRVVVTYPGRFQPFHQGHAGVFSQLQKKFGAENVFIATSNDQNSAKSPFNFSDKYQLMTAAGVPADKIIQTNAMYALPESIDPLNTIFITAVGAPDADRLNPDSVLKRDKKDKSGNIIKAAGSPGYYKKWDPSRDPVSADQHGYVIVIPEIKKSIRIGGQTYDVSHGTETRNLWNAVRDDEKSRLEFLSQLYGRPSSELANIFDKIQQTAKEDIAPGSSDSTSPIHGGQIYEQVVTEAARVARKPGQPAGSKKHSDLYTDENPKGTITGLKFATVEDARASVSKIRSSGRSHAHKIQAAVAMEQRARAAGKASAAAVYRKYINANKKTESVNQGVAEDKEKNHWYNAGVKDATRGAGPNPRTYLPTLKDKQAKHPEEVDFYMNGYKSVPQGVAEGSKMLSLDDKIKIYSKHKSQAQQAENRGDYTTADKHKKQASRIYSNIVNLHFGDDGKDAQNAANEYIRKSQAVAEGWSQKYKKSINCSHPRGFSQKAHCAGKRKHNESVETEMVCEDCGMCETHGDHSQDNLAEACWKGYHKEGMKTMFGKRYPNCVKNKNESLETYIRKGECPGCGERMVAESQLNEKQDACYHKVKSRYKVWPSAYASGALVQCRKKGAANWGNKNESITQEEYDQLDENLKKWFSDKWVRFGPDGKIRGPCARGSSSEGKPKCLPQSKAHALGKKGRASAGARKRKQDPDANRSGRAINVATKTKSNEGASGVIATKKQEQDPRYSMSLTKDVRPGQIEKNLRAFKLAEQADNNNLMFELFAKFLPLAMRDLGLTMLPKIVPELRIESTDGQASFGRFVDGEMIIQLAMANRHPVDILRTLAHELVHYKQKTLGKIKHDSGETGSPEENQANTIAGIIMRHFNKEYPDAVNMQPIDLNESQVTVNYGIGKNPGKLVKVGADGRVPHAKLHVNVNKKTAKKLGIPHLNENGDDEADEVKKQKNLIPFPKGTVKIDVSDVYDWYKLGMEISDLDDADPADFGKGPPQTVMAFGDEEQEHKYLPQLKRLGLKTHDIDENFADGRNPGDKGSLKAKVKGKVTMAKARAILKNKNSTPRAKQLAHWFINMNKGRNK